MKATSKFKFVLASFIISAQDFIHPFMGYMEPIIKTHFGSKMEFTFFNVNMFVLFLYIGIFSSFTFIPMSLKRMKIRIIMIYCLFLNSFAILSLIYLRNYLLIYLMAYILGVLDGMILHTLNFAVVLLYPDNKSGAIGYNMAGTAFATFSWGCIVTYGVNPNNLKVNSEGVFPESVNQKIPGFLYAYGLITLVLGLIGVYMFWDFDDEYKDEILQSLKNQNLDDSISLSQVSDIVTPIEERRKSRAQELKDSFQKELVELAEKSKDEVEDLNEAQFFKKYVLDKGFITLFLISIVRLSNVIYFQNNFKFITLSHINDDHFVSNMATITFILNLAIRLLIGRVIKLIGLYNVLQLIFIGFSLVSFIYILFPYSKFFYVIAISLIRIVSGAHVIVAVSTLYVIYDNQIAIKLLRYFMTVFIFSPILCNLLEMMFLEDNDYFYVFVSLAALCIVSIYALHSERKDIFKNLNE